MLTEVGLIQLQGRLAIEIVQHIAFGARDHPLRPEGVPSAQRAVTHPQPVAIQPDRGNDILLWRTVPEHECLLEAGTIA